MSDHNIEAAKKLVFKGLILLGIITLIEVFIALIGNGHIIHGFRLAKWIMYPAMIGFSLYKAYFIVYEFMHMRYEVKSLAMTVLLPLLLLVWAVIAFFQEGNSWLERREQVHHFNARVVSTAVPPAADNATKAMEAPNAPVDTTQTTAQPADTMK